jgi:glycosyltransferase involved in cell wall biosynthesis
MIVIATDAWEPQINGVVSTLKKIREECPSIHFITPNYFKTFKCPGYKDISLALVRSKSIENFMIQNQPKHIHIATEGPIGLAVRNWCIRNNKNFTTSYHTKFPEFLWAMYKIPTFITYSYMKWFHSKSSAVMVTTESLKKDLEERGFKNIVRWTRGVDLKEFFPVYYYKTKTDYPTYLYVGRVSKEKNIEAFLNLDLQGNKIVVGDGPELEKLKQKYPTVNFLGALSGADLAFVYQSASCFVFPSKTDTFGLVIIEALACGTPVAAYPVTGPIDILNDKVGAMDWDLKVACEKAVKLNPKDCYKFAKKNYNWKITAKIFISNLKV